MHEEKQGCSSLTWDLEVVFLVVHAGISANMARHLVWERSAGSSAPFEVLSSELC